MYDDINDSSLSFLGGGQRGIILLCQSSVFIGGLGSRGRFFHSREECTALLEISLQVFLVLVVIILEKENGIDDISTKGQRFVRRNRRRDTPKFRIAYQ